MFLFLFFVQEQRHPGRVVWGDEPVQSPPEQQPAAQQPRSGNLRTLQKQSSAAQNVNGFKHIWNGRAAEVLKHYFKWVFFSFFRLIFRRKLVLPKWIQNKIFCNFLSSCYRITFSFWETKPLQNYNFLEARGAVWI